MTDEELEYLPVSIQGVINNLGMAKHEESWPLVENSIERLSELKQRVKAGRVEYPDSESQDINPDYWECTGCGFSLDADVFDDKPVCPRGCYSRMKAVKEGDDE